MVGTLQGAPGPHLGVSTPCYQPLPLLGMHQAMQEPGLLSWLPAKQAARPASCVPGYWQGDTAPHPCPLPGGTYFESQGFTAGMQARLWCCREPWQGDPTARGAQQKGTARPSCLPPSWGAQLSVGPLPPAPPHGPPHPSIILTCPPTSHLSAPAPGSAPHPGQHHRAQAPVSFPCPA